MSARQPRGAISVAPENDASVRAGGSLRPPMQVLLLGSSPLLLSRDSQRPRHARAVCRVRPRAVLHMALLDVQARVAHRAGGVVEEVLLLGRSHLAEQIARLLPVVVVDAMVIMRPVAVHRHRKL